MITPKRITLFMGHYGSGKTFASVNYATYLSNRNLPVDIYDLDIVNPYFRTKDAIEFLKSKNVNLIVSPFAQTNVDIPAMNSASYKMVDDKNTFAVVDIGGDDRGALALGRFSQKIIEENNYDCLFVINKFRPETRDLQGIEQIKTEIETSSRIKFNGIVNNCNLGLETTEDIILEGENFIDEISKKLNLPIKFTCVRQDLLTDKIKTKIDNILPVTPIKYGDWL